MHLRIRTEGDDQHRVVRLFGECDIASAPELQQTLRELARPEVRQVVVDLSGVDFLDSTGLGVLFGALKRVREAGGEMRLAGVGDEVKRLLEVTGLERAMPVDA